jgi:Domain of unknown function (DUF4430)
VRLRLVGACLLAAFLAGCGGATGGNVDTGGTATLWVTRDRGTKVLLVRKVPAGISALRALAAQARVDTRYGGRFVHSINGVAGSLSGQRDWFYFVNGYEADRSAAEYRLRPGDVEWWDYRSWRKQMRAPVVVGAFPEPFLHGYGGKRRRAVVRYGSPGLAPGARALGRLIGAESVAPLRRPAPADANVLQVVEGLIPGFDAQLRRPGGPPGSPVLFVLVGNPQRLARHPGIVRFRYSWFG